jgi:hypothetical protein
MSEGLGRKRIENRRGEHVTELGPMAVVLESDVFPAKIGVGSAHELPQAQHGEIPRNHVPKTVFLARRQQHNMKLGPGFRDRLPPLHQQRVEDRQRAGDVVRHFGSNEILLNAACLRSIKAFVMECLQRRLVQAFTVGHEVT